MDLKKSKVVHFSMNGTELEFGYGNWICPCMNWRLQLRLVLDLSICEVDLEICIMEIGKLQIGNGEFGNGIGKRNWWILKLKLELEMVEGH